MASAEGSASTSAEGSASMSAEGSASVSGEGSSSMSSELTERRVRLFIYEMVVKNICMMLPHQCIYGTSVVIDAENDVSLSFWFSSKRFRIYGVGGNLKTSRNSLKDVLDEVFIQMFFVDQKKCTLNDEMNVVIKGDDLLTNSHDFEKEGDFGKYFRDFTCDVRFEVTVVSRKSVKQEECSLFNRSVNNLADDLEKLLLRGKTFSDVTIKIAGKKFHLHEFLLYQRWPHLDKLSVDFTQMKFLDYEGVPCGITQPHPKVIFIRKGRETIIKIDDSLDDIFSALLHYVYCKRIISLDISKYFQLYWTARDLEMEDLRENLLPSVWIYECEITYAFSSCTFILNNFSSRENGETVGTCVLRSKLKSEVTWKITLIRFTDSQSVQVRLQKLSSTDFALLVGFKIVTQIPNSSTHCVGRISQIIKESASLEVSELMQDIVLQCPIGAQDMFGDAVHLTCGLYTSTGENNTKFEELLSDAEGSFEGKKLSKSMYDLYINGHLSDLTLKINNFTIDVHKTLLYMRCPGFINRILKGSKASQRIVKVEQRNVPKKAVELIIMFIYTGKIDELNMDVAKMVYKASKFYNISELTDICTTYMLQNMNPQNARSILQFAEKERDLYLRYKTQDFLSSNSLLNRQDSSSKS